MIKSHLDALNEQLQGLEKEEQDLRRQLEKIALKKGSRTYLYYVATDDPLINISRVLQRSRKGGHSVPEDKTIARYKRSLGLLMQAIKCSDRAYIFDNSGHGSSWIAEIIEGKVLDLKVDDIPGWFKEVLGDKVDLR